MVNARTRILGQKNADTLSAMNELGRTYWLNDQYREALKLQTDTLKLIEPALGRTHDSTFHSHGYVTLGSLMDLGKDTRRVELAVRKITTDQTHLHTLETKNNLAMALMDLGEVERASELHE